MTGCRGPHDCRRAAFAQVGDEFAALIHKTLMILKNQHLPPTDEDVSFEGAPDSQKQLCRDVAKQITLDLAKRYHQSFEDWLTRYGLEGKVKEYTDAPEAEEGGV